MHKFYSDPTPFGSIWDCFEIAHADLLEMTEELDGHF